RVVYRHQIRTDQVLPAVETGVLNAQLERVVTEGTGAAAAIGRSVAGKTGTTQHFTNGWFVGFVPQLATAVWVGNPDRDLPMTDVHGVAVSGGTFPARIFAIVMKAALAGVPVQPIYTASPDELSLQPLVSSTSISASSSTAPSTSSSSTSSTSSSTTTTTTPPSSPDPPTSSPPT